MINEDVEMTRVDANAKVIADTGKAQAAKEIVERY